MSADTLTYQITAGDPFAKGVRKGVPVYKGLPLQYEFYDEKGHLKGVRRYSDPSKVTTRVTRDGLSVTTDRTRVGLENGIMFVNKGNQELVKWLAESPWIEGTPNKHPKAKPLFKLLDPVAEAEKVAAVTELYAEAVVTIKMMGMNKLKDTCRILGAPYKLDSISSSQAPTLRRWLYEYAKEKPQEIINFQDEGSTGDLLELVGEAKDAGVIYYVMAQRQWKWSEGKELLHEVGDSEHYKDSLAEYLKKNPQDAEKIKALLNA